MFLSNDYLLMHLFKEIERARLYEEEMYRMAKLSRRKNPGWITRPTCRLFGYLGQLMLKWGERMQKYSFSMDSSMFSSNLDANQRTRNLMRVWL
jgi:hypothetical protein